jgi:two-component system, NarL family, sensor histidine kinase DesK
VRPTSRSVEVLDDGRGAAAVNGGQGLAGLRDRARAAGARIDVGDRSDGRGFRVYVEVPA